jgi:XTP/dITP diphosphohydrolase|tara:strand:- start:87541 stop:88158 length:618 start_codon:yes stop_codon:yes gene_type:complete
MIAQSTEHRHFHGEALILATHNQGKVKEIALRLERLKITVLSANELKLPEPVEDGDSFEANAALKALAAAKATGKIALADDSGLSVTALSGAPGIYSARWAGDTKDFKAAMARVHDELGDTPNRHAAFVCVIALAWPDGHVETVRGECEGTLVWPIRGADGFGYDPMFQPDGYDVTFGEMDFAEKQTLSHRKKALDKIFAQCFTL